MSPRTRLEVATGGNPVEALARAIAPLKSNGVYRASVAHDPGCPCLSSAGAPMPYCTCEIVEITIDRANEVAA